LGLGYFLYFACFGLFLPFLSPVLAELGFAKHEIGLIHSGLSLCIASIPLAIGRLSDRVGSADLTVKICTLLMLAASVVLWHQHHSVKPVVVAIILIYGISRAPVLPMLDTLAMQEANQDPGTYSRLRLMGSIGFICSSVIAGWMLSGHFMRFFPILCLLSGFFWLHSLFLPAERKQPIARDEVGFWQSLDRSWWIWLFAMMLHWFCFGPYHYGFTFLLQEQAIPDRLHGLVWSIGVLAEIGVFLGAGWFFRHWNYRQLLFGAFAFGILRWILIGIWPHPWVIISTQVFHGPAFALFYSAALQGIRIYNGGRHRASFQALFSTCVMGISTILATGMTGYLHERFPFHQIILWMTIPQAIAAIIVFFNPLVPYADRADRLTQRIRLMEED